MPLDPFFDERLRVHRRYLFDQALGGDACARGDARPFWRAPAAPVPAAATARRARRPTRPRGTRARARAPGRSTAATRWRGTAASSRTVGTPGPDVRTIGAPRRGPGASRRARAHLLPGRQSATRPCPRCWPSSAVPSASAGSTIRRRMPPTGAAPSMPRSRSWRSTTRSRPSTAIRFQVEQGYAALVWLFEQAAELGIDPERIGIVGHLRRRRTSPPPSPS